MPGQSVNQNTNALASLGKGSRSGSIGVLVLVALTVVLALGGGALWLISRPSANSAKEALEARSFRAISRVELREEPSEGAAVKLVLREGTTVSGIPAGTHDGIAWLEVTAVDGARGFAPVTALRELGPAAPVAEVSGGTRRIVTSTVVNLRAAPSVSAAIVGVAEGGTRLTSDGGIMSEGEAWLRVPINGETTVFVMQRFTTADDDPGADNDTADTPGAIGVRGSAVAVANVQATPLPESRVVRALQPGEEVRIIGQTNAGIWWYVLRLSDGSQGFAPKDAIRVDPNAARWTYPDGTLAPGPGIPKGATTAGGARTVTLRRVSAMSAASEEGEALASFAAGQALVVTGSEAGWLRVRLPDGRTGFVAQRDTGVVAGAPRPRAASRPQGARSSGSTDAASVASPATPAAGEGAVIEEAPPASVVEADPAAPDPSAPPAPQP